MKFKIFGFANFRHFLNFYENQSIELNKEVSWGASGRRFKSFRPDQINQGIKKNI